LVWPFTAYRKQFIRCPQARVGDPQPVRHLGGEIHDVRTDTMKLDGLSLTVYRGDLDHDVGSDCVRRANDINLELSTQNASPA